MTLEQEARMKNRAEWLARLMTTVLIQSVIFFFIKIIWKGDYFWLDGFSFKDFILSWLLIGLTKKAWDAA